MSCLPVYHCVAKVASRAVYVRSSTKVDIGDLIKKLQESQLFADRRVEELNEVVLDLSRGLSSLSDRLATLEAKLGALADSLSDSDETP